MDKMIEGTEVVENEEERYKYMIEVEIIRKRDTDR